MSCYPAIASHVSRCLCFRGIYGSDSRGTCLFAGSSPSGPAAHPVPWAWDVCPICRLCLCTLSIFLSLLSIMFPIGMYPTLQYSRPYTHRLTPVFEVHHSCTCPGMQ
ncbi:hypothetical protein BV20DRAFT_601491 [Pilatotrama ljubarskyi]|nr:hypothetical protein BV20DRAFT_601491 [Pilatotrama ljubarskyi]